MQILYYLHLMPKLFNPKNPQHEKHSFFTNCYGKFIFLQKG